MVRVIVVRVTVVRVMCGEDDRGECYGDEGDGGGI